MTIQSVQDQAHDLWRYQRFLIVNEYSKKTPVPPPFNTIYYLFIALRAIPRFYSDRHQNVVDHGSFLNSLQQQWKGKSTDDDDDIYYVFLYSYGCDAT